MISALTRLDDNTLELTITIPWSKIQKDYDETLAALAKTISIKGFRQGKAPLKLVEQQANQNKIHEEILKKLIPQVYTEAVKEQKIKPILNPQISVLKLKKDEDWQIKATTCELPKFKLDGYREAIKKDLASEKIWTPDKAKEEKKEPNQEAKTAKLFKTLLTHVKLTLPGILVQQEVNRMLSRLIDQTNQLGLTVEQYLQSVHKTIEQIKKEYQQQAGEVLKLEFILAKIADQEGVAVTNEEVEKMVNAVPNEKAKKDFESGPRREYIKQILLKRKVIDSLLDL